MKVRCQACEADLQVNRNLAGTALPCPQCGERVEVPEQAPEQVAAPAARTGRRPRPEPDHAETQTRGKRAARPLPLSLSLLGAQAILGLMAAGCFAGAFFRGSWNPPATSFFGQDALLLTALGGGLVFALLAALRYPITSTLLVVLGMLLLSALHYRADRVLDASRVIAISLAMVALWLAMEHRKVT